MSVIVLVYSKYSEKCQLLEKELNFIEYRKLCIDNENVKQRIKENQTETTFFQQVPTLLIFHSNGQMEKQEGEKCFEWLEFMKKQVQQNQKETAPKEEKMVEPVSKENVDFLRNQISVEDVKFDERRKLDSAPLIQEEKNDIVEMDKIVKEQQASSSLQKNNNDKSIMNLAQQMQKQREMEDSNKQV